jgi:mitogen-activated protein kinase organizer 1
MQPKISFKAHGGSILALKWNQKGEYLLSGGTDKTIKLWNPFKSLLLREFQGHGNDILDITITKDNSAFVSASADKRVNIWDVLFFYSLIFSGSFW